MFESIRCIRKVTRRWHEMRVVVASLTSVASESEKVSARPCPATRSRSSLRASFPQSIHLPPLHMCSRRLDTFISGSPTAISPLPPPRVSTAFSRVQLSGRFGRVDGHRVSASAAEVKCRVGLKPTIAVGKHISELSFGIYAQFVVYWIPHKAYPDCRVLT